MAQTVAELVVQISAENADLKSKLNESVGAADSAFGKIGKAMIAAGAAAGVFGAAMRGIDFNAAAEQAQVSFEVMLGSADLAKKTLQDLKEYANTTPLEFKDIRDATQTLVQFGMGAGEAFKTVKILGDVSGGNAEKMKLLAVAMGQISSAGKMQGQDLMQLINSGFNPLLEISKNTGRSMADLRKDMENGAISADMVKESFKRATSEGGQFFGMLEKQGKTLTGVTSTLKDALDTMLGKMMDGFTEPLKALASMATNVMNFISSIPGPVLTAVSAFTLLGAGIAAITAAAPLMGIALSASFGPVAVAVAALVAGIAGVVSGMKVLEEKRLEAVTTPMTQMAEAIGLSAKQIESVNKGAERTIEFFQMAAKSGTVTHEKLVKWSEALGLTVPQFAQIVQSSKVVSDEQAMILRSVMTSMEKSQQQNLVMVAQGKLLDERYKSTVKIGAVEKELTDKEKKAIKEQQDEERRLAAIREKAYEDAGIAGGRYEQARLSAIYAAEVAQVQANNTFEAGYLSWHERMKAIKEAETAFAIQQANEEYEAKKAAMAKEENDRKESANRIRETAASIVSGIQSLFSAVGTEGSATLAQFVGMAGNVIAVIASKGADVNAIFGAMNAALSIAMKDNSEEMDNFKGQIESIAKQLKNDFGTVMLTIVDIVKIAADLISIIGSVTRILEPVNRIVRAIVQFVGGIVEGIAKLLGMADSAAEKAAAKAATASEKEANRRKVIIGLVGSEYSKMKLKHEEEMKQLKEVGAYEYEINQLKAKQAEELRLAFDATYQKQLADAEALRQKIASMGESITEALSSGLAAGMSKMDFFASLKENFKKMAMEAIVMASGVQAKIGAIAKKIAEGGFTGATMASAKAELSSLWDSLQGQAAAANEALSGFATGTKFAPGGVALVGEQGPELVKLPRGSEVKTNSETKAIGGAGATFIFNSPKQLSPAENAAIMRQSWRQMAFQGA